MAQSVELTFDAPPTGRSPTSGVGWPRRGCPARSVRSPASTTARTSRCSPVTTSPPRAEAELPGLVAGLDLEHPDRVGAALRTAAQLLRARPPGRPLGGAAGPAAGGRPSCAAPTGTVSSGPAAGRPHVTLARRVAAASGRPGPGRAGTGGGGGGLSPRLPPLGRRRAPSPGGSPASAPRRTLRNRLVAAATASEAPSRWSSTSPIGRPRLYCGDPDRGLAELDGQQEPRRPGCAAPTTQATVRRDGRGRPHRRAGRSPAHRRSRYAARTRRRRAGRCR